MIQINSSKKTTNCDYIKKDKNLIKYITIKIKRISLKENILNRHKASNNGFIEFMSGEYTCTYIKEKKANYRYLLIDKCETQLYDHLLSRGWRRFGKSFFVPHCYGCNLCVSIRYKVGEFIQSRNHKRIMDRNKDINITVRKPTSTQSHVDLYNKYHIAMNAKKEWDYVESDIHKYYIDFVDGAYDFGYEMLYFLGNKLIAVGLIDILPSGISSVYFIYDHDEADRSLGTYSILMQFQIAKNLKMQYIYPGQWIEDHHSMGYKDRFKPYERLINAPDVNEEAIWE